MCVSVCARLCFKLTYSDNVGHPAGVLNPKETRNQRCPVFPNRGPGRQPSISHGCKVAGSTFFKIPKMTQIRSSTLNTTDHLWGLMSASDVRSLYLVKHFSLSFFVLLQVCERLDQDEAPPVPHQRIGVNTCERRLLQLPRRSL